MTDLRTLYSQIGFETSNVPRVPGIMVGFLDRLAIVLPAASLAHRSIITLEKTGEMPDGLRSDLRDISVQISAIAEGKRVGTDTVLATLSARSEMLWKNTQASRWRYSSWWSAAAERQRFDRMPKLAIALNDSPPQRRLAIRPG